MIERRTKEADMDCPACGRNEVVARWGGDKPAIVKCQSCGHQATSVE